MLISSIMKEFKVEKRFEGVKDSTLVGYDDTFKCFNKYLSDRGIEHLEDISTRTIKSYLMYLIDEQGNKPVSANSKLNRLRVFFKWLYKEKLTTTLLTHGIKAMKTDIEPKHISIEDVRVVLSHLRRNRRREDSFTSRRNYTLMLTFISTGLRLAEVTRLEWNHISFSEGMVRIIETKSRTMQSVPLSETLAEELIEWKVFLDSKFDVLPPNVFVTERGKPLSRNAIQSLFKKLRTRLGLQSKFSPHVLRAFYIKSLLENGTNLREVQLLARHSKISVTQLYLHYNSHELKNTLNKNDPLNNLL